MLLGSFYFVNFYLWRFPTFALSIVASEFTTIKSYQCCFLTLSANKGKIALLFKYVGIYVNLFMSHVLPTFIYFFEALLYVSYRVRIKYFDTCSIRKLF